MNPQFSVYLDLLRFVAASLVFFEHLPGRCGGYFWQLSGWGHEAVVFFFVLSGFVIGFVVFEKKQGARDYWVSRSARIYSVALPSLLLTIPLFYLGNEIDPAPLSNINVQRPFLTLALALAFLNESWHSVTVFSNPPYWSLGYEVPFYILFGVATYVSGWGRLLILGSLALLFGPSVMLYMLIWIMGVVCFRLTRSYPLKTQSSTFLLVASLTAMAIITQSPVQDYVNTWLRENCETLALRPPKRLAADTLLALSIAVHFLAVQNFFRRFVVFNDKVTSVIRWFASKTFSLYLFHMPLLFFVSTVVPFESYPVTNVFACVLLVPLMILVLSKLTEDRKDSYRSFFLNVYNRFHFQHR